MSHHVIPKERSALRAGFLLLVVVGMTLIFCNYARNPLLATKNTKNTKARRKK